ncbi:SprB repeat-containing protein [Flavobacterium sp. LS1R49]|uniref:SprB repeat-containing protein n=1 Tax=Flavobacterium shii TaxID=2987687 RepID=A0A9X2YTY2_9FLAO|nr:SprB repeat-containing protein [Flavobacterium shii]MCV9926824.1 SprB repeat-containing protein [Flavobacterium shii]
MQITNSQTTYKYKVKWDLRISSVSGGSGSSLNFYLNTGDTYPFNGTYARATANSINTNSSFSYILKNSNVNALDGVVVSNTPLRLSEAVESGSSGFLQTHGPLLTAPYSGYWQSYFGSGLGGIMVSHNSRFEFYYLQPIAELNNYSASNTDLKQCEPFNFSVAIVGEGGQMTFAVEYFHSNSVGWKDLLPYELRSAQTIPITFAMIPSLQLNQNFQLRARYTKTGSGGTNDYSDILTYKFIPCPPLLLGAPITTKTSCIYNQDGEVTFTFNRDLINNEHFLLNLTQVVNGNNLPPIPKDITSANFPNRQITFTDLKSGTYFLHYQTFQDNGALPTSDTKSDPFIIQPPIALRYEITPTDPLCNSGTGEILINTFGGTPPYFYSINNGTKTQFTNPTTTDANGHKGSLIITKQEGVYNIKITDDNDCIETI